MLLPPSVLRSCIQVERDPRVEENLRILTRELALEGIDGFIVESLAEILDRARDVPSLYQVKDWATRLELQGDARGSAAAARLEGLESAPFISGTDFRYALDAFKEGLLRQSLGDAILEAGTILSTGVQKQVPAGSGQWRPQVLQGPADAIAALSKRLGTITRQVRGIGAEGELRADTRKFQQEVDRRAANPNRRGALSGIKQIDQIHNGIQPGQLVLVLGFTAHLKSTLCFNWVYRTVVEQGLNAGLVNLEMSTFAMQTAMALMHCASPQFERDRADLKITKDKIKTGLNPREREFLRAVMDDLTTNEKYGRLYYREGQTVITMEDIARWAEGVNRENRLDLLAIDYLGLVDRGATVGEGLTGHGGLNVVVRQAKLLANSFDNGRGIGVLSPFQSNREGYKEAEKNSGRYRLTAMYMTPEAEKSADLVYSTYLDEGLTAANELLIGNLKARDDKMFTELVKVFADPDTRVIADLADEEQPPSAIQDL